MSSDTYNYLSRLTLRKYINIFNLGFSYNLSGRTKKYYLSGLPASITIEPTTSCNLCCPECPVGTKKITRPSGNMDPALFKKIIDELHPHLSYLMMYFQGEPYLHPEFFNMIEYADKKGIFSATSTNAHFLDEKNAEKTIRSGLQRLIISVDGTTQEIYSKYRIGGELNKVVDGIENIINLKKELRSKTPYIVVQFLVFRFNQHQIGEIMALGKKSGVDKVEIKTARIDDPENANDYIPSIDRYSRYSQNPDGTYSIKSNFPDFCRRMWTSAVITWDGKVVPCCFDKNAEHIMGDINKCSFREIWRNKPYENFRRSVLNSRKSINICTNCTEGLRNQVN